MANFKHKRVIFTHKLVKMGSLCTYLAYNVRLLPIITRKNYKITSKLR